MPRYFFHLRRDDKSLLDCEGIMLRGDEAARQEALRTVSDFCPPGSGRVSPEWEAWTIDVRNTRGTCLLLLPFSNALKLREAQAERMRSVPASAPVIDLNFVRARRELISLETTTRELVRRAAALVDRSRYETKHLTRLARSMEEGRQRAAELVARSRDQTSSLNRTALEGGGGARRELASR